MTTSTKKTGVTDAAAGAGVAEYLGLSGPLAALLQACSIIPIGDQWQIKGSLSFTPTLITDTLPPSPLMGWKVPSDRALLWTGGILHTLAASTDYVRVCRRYFLGGWQATAAPAAPAAPTVALLALTSGIATSGARTYKLAPIDSFRRESAATVASSSVTHTSTNQGTTVTPPALPSGAIGYNVYRTLGGGSTYYFVGTTIGATAYLDAQSDTAINPATNGGVDRQPTATWATGFVTGEVMEGPGEVIAEVGAVALTGAPTTLVYTGTYGEQQQAVLATFPTTVGQRIRLKPAGEANNFIAVATASANLWRGLYGSDARDRHEEDLGVTAVSGFNAGPSAGALIIWGQQVIGVTERDELTAGIKSKQILPLNPHGILIPPLGEIVCEIGALAAGVAAVRDVSLSGLLIPIAGT